MLIDKFRELRKFWFNYHLKSYAHEREWEDKHSQIKRQKENENLWQQYSQQTEDIINGLDRCIAPTSSYEMDIKK